MTQDLLLNARDEVATRKRLLQVSLGRLPADRILRVGRLFESGTGTWMNDAEIVISGRRIAFVGPRGSYTGEAAEVIERPDLAAVPGFGEVHKHIESSHLTPEYEAALTIPRGCTWTCEASHEYSNVNGAHNLEFWLTARKAGSPLKIFPLPGSAVPPTAWEYGGGYFGKDEQAAFMADPMVAGLDEVMDWPAVCNADNPSHDRLWGVIEATIAARGVVEGHAAGIKDIMNINAFAAAGLASDHESWTADEAWDKITRGLFLEIRVHSMPDIVKGLLERGLSDWSQVAFATDDRSASDTLRLGGTDHNVRTAIRAGLSPEKAIQCVTINPARHMRLQAHVGMIAPGRYADIVLLSDVADLQIAEVWADGLPASKGTDYIGALPAIDWPAWARTSVHINREITAADFALHHDGDVADVALLRPFHWAPDFIRDQLPVVGGEVQRDTARNITKFAIIDRHTGAARVAKMFWLGTGPATPDTAVGCTVAHDQHNLWIVGSSDAAMAMVANRMRQTQGGWVLASGGEIRAEVHYEIGGLMTHRPAEALHADMEAFYAEANKIDWMYEPTYSPRWWAGFPERLQFATLTCAPWAWALVAPSDAIPQGFVNVQTGETHPVVW
ncbi:adenine deaminase [Ketogulonicigenium vulgare]|uniref:adenine deaminase n=1 Tax=Ketogulonicigenium vulgare (strain WSH-001) TaxID=759362 RepID=F9Y529_KETVW|nr:adenine deaminase C-terminal domain-containing protein [Ketogulonicigenium vulgare]ADO42462.1 adenine deaminase [Ketogulonicigenium vulgare Y25]AEM40661.1 Adenine deaminase 2 [Ketogulonicigenium vulgare WSH-001]ALJ80834.1 adenosine deaminase [Ketogulonicigenium vulgare]ANW33613.1 adenosine deaminase [Ketogulonicigenium vulgare]AOZ54375.1 adenine deaminase [Ketogulonicigenium vulgare]